MKRVSHLFNLLYFKMGEVIFPLSEPLLRLVENKNPEVRRHFNQALLSLGKRKQAIALLNLNMVLSLKPNHFLARVFRGRIYIREGQYRLASEDYLEANKISQYRFIHYDLYREYFRSVNTEFGGNSSTIIQSFNQVFETLHLNQDANSRELDLDNGQAFQDNPSIVEADLQEGDIVSFQDLSLNPEEREKFQILGPISQDELEGYDWDHLMDDLNL